MKIREVILVESSVSKQFVKTQRSKFTKNFFFLSKSQEAAH
jgi:hypothetical protein